MKKLKILFYSYLLFAICYLLAGCATVPTREALTLYNLNGISYLALVPLCESRGINWEYDTFTRTATLSKDTHKINLMVGDTMVLVDGNPTHLRHPVDIYQGMVVVPERFKEQVIDVLFKEPYAPGRAVLPLSQIKKIVVDSGHGGNDPGAIGRTSGLREKDVNLDIAKRLSRLLRAEGIEVVMTRSTDRFVPLDTRVSIANNSGADLFLSIHSNANRVKSLSGFEIYYVSPAVSDSQRAYQAVIGNAPLNLDNATLANRSLNLKATLWDMIYTNARAESIELARSICRAMGNNSAARVFRIKEARFEVLRGVRMPAILIETGFLSNYNEERMLKDSYYRQKIAEGILQGINNYAQDLTLAQRD